MDLTPVEPDTAPDATRHPSHPVTAQGTIDQAHMASKISSPPIEASADESSETGILTAEHINMAKRAKVVRALPNEILDNIFIRLDTAAPSDSKLYDEPTFDLTFSKNNDLKSSSLVCWRWRRAVLPLLFKHMCLLIRDPGMPKPIMRNEYFALADFVRRNGLKSVITSFALCIRNVGFRPFFTTYLEMKENNFAPFWTKLFEIMHPLDVKIVAPVSVLGLITGCNVSFENYDYFQAPYHYLQLRLPIAKPASGPPSSASSQDEQEEQEERDPVRPSALFESRPWTGLLLNEGSFIEAYKREDFHEKEAPSILEDLVGDNGKGIHTAMIPPTVRDFSYIAIFPTSTHFHKVTRCCPRLDRLYTQFVARNDILNDPVAMEYIDPNDMWLERNSCYAYIMRELFSSPPQGNYRYLREFESGDAADVDAWEMAVEYVKRAGGGWQVEKPGVFVKDMELARKQKDKTEFEEGQVPSLLSVPSDDLA
jgi:hypothetical protein